MTNILSPFQMFNCYSGMYGLLPPNGAMNRPTFLLIQKFLNIFCERFKYENLPEGITETARQKNFIDYVLFFAPSLVFFKHPTLGVMCLPTTGEYDFNVLGQPTKWRVSSPSGYNAEFNAENSVLMFNDNAFSIPFIHVMYEIDFMLECDNTHRQALHAQRQPIIMEYEDGEEISSKRFESKLARFADVIMTKVIKRNKKEPQRNPYNTQVFRATEKAFDGKVFMDDYKEFENRVLTYFGINNISIEKRERLLTGEISANDMLIQTYFTSALEARRSALDKVNKMFGLDIKVEPTELMALQAQNLNTQQQFLMGKKSLQNQPMTGRDENV